VAHVSNCRVVYGFTACPTWGEILARYTYKLLFFEMERDSHDYTVAYLFGDCPQAKELELSSTSACRQEAAHGRTVIA
jgi:hypothetical protein